MTIFIVCHKDLPSYPPPEGSKIIWLNSKPPLDNKGMDVIAGYDFFSEPEEIHAKLSGSLGTIVIAKVVSEEAAKPRNITIWQYRKFLTRLKIGTPKSRISRDEYSNLRRSRNHKTGESGDFYRKLLLTSAIKSP